MSLGSTLLYRRKELSMTQDSVAQSIGRITTQAVRNWEMDKSVPTDAHLVQLSQILQLDLDLLQRMAGEARAIIQAELDRKANDPLPLFLQQIRDLFKRR